MKHGSASRQRGISFFGLIFVMAILGGLGFVGLKAFPTVLEYTAALKAIKKASAGNTPGEVRTIFDKAAQIDDINSITGKDLEIAKDGDNMLVKFAYNKEIALFGPAYLLLKYTGSSK